MGDCDRTKETLNLVTWGSEMLKDLTLIAWVRARFTFSCCGHYLMFKNRSICVGSLGNRSFFI